jgi:ElaB/YqjD/DUF883 family membrane-anchored ribosome-binding protein
MNNQHDNQDHENHDVEALRDDIEVTRQRISGEIEAIGGKLTTGHAKDVARSRVYEARDRARHRVVQARERAMERMGTTVRSAGDAARHAGEHVPEVVRDNPIPTAMVAIGATWLTIDIIRRGRHRQEMRGRGEPELDLRTGPPEAYGSEVYPGEYETTGSTSHQLRDRAGSYAQRGREYAERGRHGAIEARERSMDAFENNPLVFGAVCVLTGVGLGMLLPRTQREDRMLGRPRERVIDRARHVAEDAKDAAMHSAWEGIHAAPETAREDFEQVERSEVEAE